MATIPTPPPPASYGPADNLEQQAQASDNRQDLKLLLGYNNCIQVATTGIKKTLQLHQISTVLNQILRMEKKIEERAIFW